MLESPKNLSALRHKKKINSNIMAPEPTFHDHLLLSLTTWIFKCRQTDRGEKIMLNLILLHFLGFFIWSFEVDVSFNLINFTFKLASL